MSLRPRHRHFSSGSRITSATQKPPETKEGRQEQLSTSPAAEEPGAINKDEKQA